MKNNSLFQVSSEITHALEKNLPTVALESTLISHGLPYPDNLETVKSMQEAILAEGAIPAVIGIIEGQIKIGLNEDEIQLFSTDVKKILKINRADISYCMSTKQYGATTVSATAFCATKAGLRFFGTGGIGGVHRGAESSFDISCDLTELSNAPIVVVCSGAKSILDIPKTLEYLETVGVPVIGYKTDSFPLFYSTASSYSLHQRVDSAQAAAQLAHLHFSLEQKGGMIIANPIDLEASLDGTEVEKHIAAAIDACNLEGTRGKTVTPYVLRKLFEITQGKTLVANKQLLIQNARLAAKISYAYHKLLF